MVATSNRQTRYKTQKNIKTNLKLKRLESANETNLSETSKKLSEIPFDFQGKLADYY